MTAANKIRAMLEEDPSLADDYQYLADQAGCKRNWVTAVVARWLEEQDPPERLDWVMEGLPIECGGCRECPLTNLCRAIDTVGLPGLCENVSKADMQIYEMRGVTEILDKARWAGKKILGAGGRQ